MREYWQEVMQYIEEITGIEMADDLWRCLFHSTNKTIKEHSAAIYAKCGKRSNPQKMARHRMNLKKGMV